MSLKSKSSIICLPWEIIWTDGNLRHREAQGRFRAERILMDNLKGACYNKINSNAPESIFDADECIGKMSWTA